MSESIRILLYPLGFLSGAAFGTRVLWQWIASEMKGESVVPKPFWVLTIIGNLLAFVHSLIQMQYHVCIIAVCNGIIAWRNLNLMKPSSQQYTFAFTLILLLGAVGFTTGLFFLQEGDSWFRIPINQLYQGAPKKVSSIWHWIGFLGIALFSSRFWLQWILSELKGSSVLNAPFWWVSLIGGYMSIGYFFYIHDIVNAIGPLLGTVPYLRNLMLIYRNE